MDISVPIAIGGKVPEIDHTGGAVLQPLKTPKA